MAKKRLERDDDLLPAQRAARPAIDFSGGLFEPVPCNVMAPQVRRESMATEPSGIDQKAFGSSRSSWFSLRAFRSTILSKIAQ
jgi:hypothetical protein